MDSWLRGILENDLWTRALAVLLDCGAKGLVLLTLAALATAAMRRSSAASRHLVWTLAMGGLLLLPALSVVLPKWQLRILPQAVAVAPGKDARDGKDVRDGGSVDNLSAHADVAPAGPARRMPGPVAASASAPVAVPSAPSAAPAPSTPSAPMAPLAPLAAPVQLPLPVLILAGWMAAVLAIFAPLVAGLAVVARMTRKSRPLAGEDWPGLTRSLTAALGLLQSVRVLCAGREAMPMATGLLRPTILLPDEAEGWPEEKRRAVLLHELAHVKRRDVLIHAVARVAVALHWFNPLAWLALRRLRVERERACDDLVLTTGERPSDYAGHLLDIARTMTAGTLASVAAITMAKVGQLEGRLLAILDDNRDRKAINQQSIKIGLIVLLLIALPLSVVQMSQKNPAAEKLISPPPSPVLRYLAWQSDGDRWWNSKHWLDPKIQKAWKPDGKEVALNEININPLYQYTALNGDPDPDETADSRYLNIALAWDGAAPSWSSGLEVEGQEGDRIKYRRSGTNEDTKLKGRVWQTYSLVTTSTAPLPDRVTLAMKYSSGEPREQGAITGNVIGDRDLGDGLTVKVTRTADLKNPAITRVEITDSNGAESRICRAEFLPNRAGQRQMNQTGMWRSSDEWVSKDSKKHWAFDVPIATEMIDKIRILTQPIVTARFETRLLPFAGAGPAAANEKPTPNAASLVAFYQEAFDYANQGDEAKLLKLMGQTFLMNSRRSVENAPLRLKSVYADDVDILVISQPIDHKGSVAKGSADEIRIQKSIKNHLSGDYQRGIASRDFTGDQELYFLNTHPSARLIFPQNPDLAKSVPAGVALKLTAHTLYQAGEDPVVYFEMLPASWCIEDPQQGSNKEPPMPVLRVNGKEFQGRVGFSPGTGTALHLINDSWDVNDAGDRLAFPPGKYRVSYAYPPFRMLPANGSSRIPGGKPVEVIGLESNEVEFEVVEKLPAGYFKSEYQPGWEEILKQKLTTPFTDDWLKSGVSGTLLIMRFEPLPFNTAFKVFAQQEGSPERIPVTEVALKKESRMTCGAQPKTMTWDNVRQTRWRLILEPSEDVARRNPPIRSYYGRTFITDWLSFVPSAQFNDHRLVEPLLALGVNEGGGPGLKINAIMPIDLDRKRSWPELRGAVWPLPLDFELGWDPSPGGGLRINPQSAVRLLPLPAAHDPVEAVTQLREQDAQLAASKVDRLSGSAGKEVFGGVLSSERERFLVRLVKGDDAFGTVTWWRVPQKNGDGGIPAKAGTPKLIATPAATTTATLDSPTSATKPTAQQLRYVRIVADRTKMTFEGREATLAELPKLLAAVPDRANTVIEFVVPMDLLISSNSRDYEFSNQAHDAVRKLVEGRPMTEENPEEPGLGFRALEDAEHGMMIFGPLGSLGSARFEGPLEFGKPIPCAMKIGTARTSDVLHTRWLQIDRDGDQVKIQVHGSVLLRPQSYWSVNVMMHDAKGEILVLSSGFLTQYNPNEALASQQPGQWADFDLDLMNSGTANRNQKNVRVGLSALGLDLLDRGLGIYYYPGAKEALDGPERAVRFEVILSEFGATNGIGDGSGWLQVNPNVTPPTGSNPPTLRMIDWQPDWKNGVKANPDAAWHSDGSAVTAAEERDAIANYPMPFSSDPANKDAVFARFWFHDPEFDEQTEYDAFITKPEGPGGYGGNNDPQAIKRFKPWRVMETSIGTSAAMPRQVNIELRYTKGPWDESRDKLALDFRGKLWSLPEVTIENVNQAGANKTMLTFSVTGDKADGYQYIVVATLKNGNELPVRSGESQMYFGKPESRRYWFTIRVAPSEIVSYQIRRRRYERVTFENVPVQPPAKANNP